MRHGNSAGGLGEGYRSGAGIRHCDGTAQRIVEIARRVDLGSGAVQSCHRGPQVALDRRQRPGVVGMDHQDGGIARGIGNGTHLGRGATERAFAAAVAIACLEPHRSSHAVDRGGHAATHPEVAIVDDIVGVDTHPALGSGHLLGHAAEVALSVVGVGRRDAIRIRALLQFPPAAGGGLGGVVRKTFGIGLGISVQVAVELFPNRASESVLIGLLPFPRGRGGRRAGDLGENRSDSFVEIRGQLDHSLRIRAVIIADGMRSAATHRLHLAIGEARRHHRAGVGPRDRNIPPAVGVGVLGVGPRISHLVFTVLGVGPRISHLVFTSPSRGPPHAG
ncbi:hypothetical protein Hsar01_03790 [Haloferula sargassicola]|uniref:Uncharacterized protein n=1 Tax=Haloferula sargassicola TaxID=490096 RepID=A0ABP9UVX5_9BACT